MCHAAVRSRSHAMQIAVSRLIECLLKWMRKTVMTSEPTVFIVDDDATVRESVSSLLVAHGLNSESFASAEEFLSRYDASRPGCLVLDLQMPGMTGLELQLQLQERSISLPVIFFSGNADVKSAVAGLRRGAADFLEKPHQPAALVSAVKDAIEQDRGARQQEQESAEVRARLDTLTEREQDVLDLIVAGKQTKEIAKLLGTASNTVGNQRTSIMRKMNADSATDLVRMVTTLTLPQ